MTRDEISWLIEVEILPGQLDAFRAVSKDLTTASRMEAGTLAYEWFLSDDGTTCHIYERYKDSAALIAHDATFAPCAERFLKACRPTRFHVYGSPSEEAKKMIEGLHPVYLPLLDGFSS